MRNIDWADIWRVERDICYLYHELSEVSGIIGDLAYGLIYDMPYWEFFNLSSFPMPDSKKKFIREGCLVMVLAMAWDVMDGSGFYLVDKMPQCQQAINNIAATDDDERQLIFAVNLALKTVEAGSQPSDALNQISVWVNRTYVRGYFESRLTKSHR